MTMHPAPVERLRAFLQPLHVDASLVRQLAREFHACFAHLAANSQDQFLGTPISESILKPIARSEAGQGR